MASSTVVGQQFAVVCYLQGGAPPTDPILVLSGLQVQCGGSVYAYLEPVQSGASSGSSDVPVSGGADAGMLIGGSVFAVLAVAFGLRTLRRFLDSSSEG
jgi:hypothetical protein